MRAARSYEKMHNLTGITIVNISRNILSYNMLQPIATQESAARLSEIYAFSYCVHHIAHRTGPKEVLKGVENRCQTFLTTYKQLNHIPDTIASRIWPKLLKIFVID